MAEPEGNKYRIEPAQWWVVAFVVAAICGSVLYRHLMGMRYLHSAAMFIGIPAVLAVVLAMTPKAKTVTGGIVKGITLALLVIAPLLGEGYLCILMAAPLFYVVGLLVGIPVDIAKRKARGGETLSCMVILLLPFCLEGVVPQLTFSRGQTVEVTKIVDSPASRVEEALAESPRIGMRLPEFLRIGFPHPLDAKGCGLDVGAQRAILFSGAEGDPAGWLVMRVAARQPGFVRFETISDGSKLTQWILWDASEVAWAPLDGQHTRVTWRIHFDRQLDPAWYFTPLERAAVREAAGYLIDANAGPVGEPR
jgi:hypothetical protein